MLKLWKIAVTGGVGTGKSTVCRLLGQLGAYVVSADAIVHELYDEIPEKIVRLLGPEIIQNGQINKSIVASLVFNDPDRLRELEKLLHPLVLRRIDEKYQKACQGNYPAFAVEIPLLFEIGAEKDYDAVIVVEANEEVARRRSGYSEKEYQARMKRRIRPKTAKYVIQNNGTLKDLEKEVEKVMKEIHES
jgi:dephospho-CoA kinase